VWGNKGGEEERLGKIGEWGVVEKEDSTTPLFLEVEAHASHIEGKFGGRKAT